MSKRDHIREAYRDGWREMDPEKLIATLAPDFVFDDPALYRCWQTQIPYNESAYLKALEYRGSPLLKQFATPKTP